jgi:hypothetical protein
MLPRLVAIALLVLSSGCNNPTGEEPVPNGAISLQLTGTWDLHSINGQTLPAFLVNNVSQKYEVSTESYVLRPDLTYTRTQAYRIATPASAPFEEKSLLQTGTYFADAGSVTLTGTANGLPFTLYIARNGVDLVVQILQTNQTLVYKPR